MRTEKVHTLILGAGPAGLAAGYVLAKAGLKPLILERDKVCGGLMRSVKRGEFVVDVGRKELYNRLQKVDEFWQKILGDDYRTYEHRGGLLFDGLIIDQSPAYQGFRRGMPWGMFLGCTFDFLRAQAGLAGSKPRNLEEYFYQQRGRRLTQIVSQGFQEKLAGRKWSEIKLADNQSNGKDAGFFKTMKGLMVRTFSAKEPNTFKGMWRHPARGTGQICDFLERGLVEAGGRVVNSAKLLSMTSADGLITEVTAENPVETVVYQPQHVISSIPLEALAQLLLDRRMESAVPDKSSPFRKKTVILVYLFLDESPQFPHAWLNVTCPNTRIGRITNYTAFNGDMVPKGKTCLCLEYYCFDDEPMLKMDDKQFVELALSECEKFHLANRAKNVDSLVLRLPGADASQNRHNWLSKIRMGLLADLKFFRNLYYANRTDLDIATLAGIESAEAVISGDRSEFDRHIDPTQIGIRSEGKAFEFKKPAGIDN